MNVLLGMYEMTCIYIYICMYVFKCLFIYTYKYIYGCIAVVIAFFIGMIYKYTYYLFKSSKIETIVLKKLLPRESITISLHKVPWIMFKYNLHNYHQTV